jgi:hypothetical protein
LEHFHLHAEDFRGVAMDRETDCTGEFATTLTLRRRVPK